MEKTFSSNNIIKTIALFRLFKALVLIITGIAIHSYLNGNHELFEDFSEILNLAPAHNLIHKLLLKISLIDKKTFKHISTGAFIYAGLFMIEGIGLLMGKKWAEYFTCIITISFIPIEIYELIKRVSIVKFLVIFLNILIVIYIINKLLKDKHKT